MSIIAALLLSIPFLTLLNWSSVPKKPYKMKQQIRLLDRKGRLIKTYYSDINY